MSLADSAARMDKARSEEMNTWFRLLWISSLFTFPLVIMHYNKTFGYNFNTGHDEAWKCWLSVFLATPVQFGVGWKFYVAAYHSFPTLGMDFLVCLGTSAAYLYSMIVLLIDLCVPAPMAMPTSALANATESLIPSPTMAILPHSSFDVKQPLTSKLL